MHQRHVSLPPDQWVRVLALVRSTLGDPVRRPGELRGWSQQRGQWFAHVHDAPAGEGGGFIVRLAPDRVQGALPPG